MSETETTTPSSKTTPETILRDLGHRVEEIRFEYVLGDRSTATVIRLRPEGVT